MKKQIVYNTLYNGMYKQVCMNINYWRQLSDNNLTFLKPLSINSRLWDNLFSALRHELEVICVIMTKLTSGFRVNIFKWLQNLGGIPFVKHIFINNISL